LNSTLALNINTLSYNEYLNIFTKQISVENSELLSEYERKYFENRKINFQRTSRLNKTFIPAAETKHLFTQIVNPQQWIVITESWCGDSAQNLPILTKLASLSEKIDFKIVLRDSNLDFMDLYLTNGTRSIPKLIVFDENDDELFRWGPRPVEAKNLFAKLKNEEVEKPEINKQLHLWYGRNRGKEVEKEIVELVKMNLIQTDIEKKTTTFFTFIGK
jgi:hypothetical protein